MGVWYWSIVLSVIVWVSAMLSHAGVHMKLPRNEPITLFLRPPRTGGQPQAASSRGRELSASVERAFRSTTIVARRFRLKWAMRESATFHEARCQCGLGSLRLRVRGDTFLAIPRVR